MNHELLRTAATGDKALLEQVIGLRKTMEASSKLASAGGA